MDGYVKFEKVGTTRSGKTDIHEVTNEWENFLGDIKWYAPWRRYVFFPDEGCKFDAACLHEIAEFCATLMKERKASTSTKG